MSDDGAARTPPTPGGRLRAGASLGFVVYLVMTGLAAVPAWMAQAGLRAALDRLPAGPGGVVEPGGAVMLEALQQAGRSTGPMVGVATLIGAGTAIALSPLLQMAWLAAMAEPLPVWRAFAVGVRRYFPAVAVTILLAARMVAPVALSLCLPLLVHHVVGPRPDARLHDVAMAIACAPAAAVLLVWATAHDLARAALSERDGTLHALARGLGALRPRMAAAYVGWGAVGAILVLIGAAVAGHLAEGGFVGGIVALAVSQLAALGRVFARGRWLAEAGHATARPPHG